MIFDGCCKSIREYGSTPIFPPPPLTSYSHKNQNSIQILIKNMKKREKNFKKIEERQKIYRLKILEVEMYIGREKRR